MTDHPVVDLLELETEAARADAVARATAQAVESTAPSTTLADRQTAQRATR